MPLRPEQHRQPKPEDIPPWPTGSRTEQLKWLAVRYRRDLATLAGSLISLGITTDIKYATSSKAADTSRLLRYPTMQCCLDMYRRGGPPEFYRGITAPMVAVSVYRGINMWAYRQCKWAGDKLINATTGVAPLVQVNTVGSKPTVHTVACFTLAGIGAGAAGAFYTSPLELIKYGQQLANKIAHEKTADGLSAQDKKLRDSYSGQRSIGEISRIIHRNFGWRGFFMGFKYHFVRDAIGGGTYFGVYEYVKHSLGPQQGREAADALTVTLAGGACGAFSTAVLMPYDTAKSRYQKECLSSVQRPQFPEWSYTRNFKRNFPGFGIIMARSAFTHGLFFLVYESIKTEIEFKYMSDLH